MNNPFRMFNSDTTNLTTGDYTTHEWIKTWREMQADACLFNVRIHQFDLATRAAEIDAELRDLYIASSL